MKVKVFGSGRAAVGRCWWVWVTDVLERRSLGLWVCRAAFVA
jgi:hypothetical protein